MKEICLSLTAIRVLTPLINNLEKINEGNMFKFDGNPIVISDFRNTRLVSKEARNYKGLKRSSPANSIDSVISAVYSLQGFQNQQKIDWDFYINQ